MNFSAAWQWQTETILRDHLQSLGVNIEYGTEVEVDRR